MKSYVLDSYAVLAYLQGEEGAEELRFLFSEAGKNKVKLFLSVVNLGEAVYIIERAAGLPAVHKFLALLHELPVEVVGVDLEMALEAAHFKASLPIAYADCFALALAKITNSRVVTGDPEFKKAERLAPVHWLPQKAPRKTRENPKEPPS